MQCGTQTVYFNIIPLTPHGTTHDTQERLSETCLTFLNISPESEVYPLCRDYPMLVDLTSKELISSHFMRSQVMNFQAFKLPFVCGLSPKSNEWPSTSVFPVSQELLRTY